MVHGSLQGLAVSLSRSTTTTSRDLRILAIVFYLALQMQDYSARSRASPLIVTLFNAVGQLLLLEQFWTVLLYDLNYNL